MSVKGAVKWTRPGDVYDRRGLFAYMHIVRAPGDPERRPRWSEQPVHSRPTKKKWDADKDAVLNRTRDWWRTAIVDVLTRTRRAMTFNAMGVVIADVTADVAPDAADDALWALVAEGVLVHTLSRPVLFKLVPKTKRPRPRRARIDMNLFPTQESTS